MWKFKSFISKKIQLLLSRFSPLNAYFCEAITNKNHNKKKNMGITIFVSLQNDKGTISASNDHFAIGD